MTSCCSVGDRTSTDCRIPWNELLIPRRGAASHLCDNPRGVDAAMHVLIRPRTLTYRQGVPEMSRRVNILVWRGQVRWECSRSFRAIYTCSGRFVLKQSGDIVSDDKKREQLSRKFRCFLTVEGSSNSSVCILFAAQTLNAPPASRSFSCVSKTRFWARGVVQCTTGVNLRTSDHVGLIVNINDWEVRSNADRW